MSDRKKTIIHNPVIYADVPDVDTIRIKDTYYMVSTSMHTMPGCPIMRSKDLAHWEIINYVFDSLEDNEAHNLQDNKGIYGQGSWAASLREKDGFCYVIFSSNDMKYFYIYRTEDIDRGHWECICKIDEILHDPALLFDGDTPYVIFGNGDIEVVEFEKDLSGIKEGGLRQQIISTPSEGIMLRAEGGHAYKINGMYYLLFIEWTSTGNRRRREVCYRSKKLLGPYECKVIFDDDMGYWNNGIAQGCIFDTEAGDWYAMLFQDRGSVGRVPFVLPMEWKEGWPMIGVDNKSPFTLEVPFEEKSISPIVIEDEFDYPENKLKLNWQWNHNPDNSLWSFTERPGYLRMKTGYITERGVLYARNTLTQRTEGPACTGTLRIELTNMKPGDCVGLLALQSTFGMVGIRKDAEGTNRVVMCTNRGDYLEKEEESVEYSKDSIYFKITCNFEDNTDIASFYFSEDGLCWNKIGCELHMKYLLDHFMGYRFGLFNYACKVTGGYVDFDYFHYRQGIV
ncbi:MAG: glycoside hydrolase family 43 [Herbinix sp.]|nr:glycoside hydrolase family 43 [Herbinix sp.]